MLGAVMEWWRDEYVISDDPARLDAGVIHRYLSEDSYWARGRSREVVERSIDHSLCVGLYGPGGELAGFGRAVTDRATFAWLADVFVLEGHRGRGLGAWLVETLLAHPELRDVYRFTLATDDAHELYLRFGFQRVAGHARNMELMRGGD
jgi:GNAT superfamily N-acetyltransferase